MFVMPEHLSQLEIKILWCYKTNERRVKSDQLLAINRTTGFSWCHSGLSAATSSPLHTVNASDSWIFTSACPSHHFKYTFVLVVSIHVCLQCIGPWRLALAGGIAGCCFWTAMFPTDVVKSRIQVRQCWSACAQHVQYMCSSRAQPVQYMCSSCAWYVQFVCSSCAQHVQYMCSLCAWYVHLRTG